MRKLTLAALVLVTIVVVAEASPMERSGTSRKTGASNRSLRWATFLSQLVLLRFAGLRLINVASITRLASIGAHFFIHRQD
ncbi:unnamed protein product [Notodromas monacha]|uniref:Secreted protein n=1 Tax=Notodromas monacha TaxID=399045 RepID=A0A7R9BT08_9CRUS|nr:unnamed protein product [Notodromas monacha]CAG0921201.1 unnamed protein product [Notodromas monacha]